MNKWESSICVKGEELLMFWWLLQTEGLGSWLWAKKTTSTQA